MGKDAYAPLDAADLAKILPQIWADATADATAPRAESRALAAWGMLLGLYAGLSAGEVRALRVGDVLPPSRRHYVPVCGPRERVTLITPAFDGELQRWAGLHDAEISRRTGARRVGAYAPLLAHAPAHAYGHARPLGREAIPARLDAITAAAGLGTRYAPRSLRNTHAAALLGAGASADALALHMGLAPDGAALGAYVRAADAIGAHAAAALGAALGACFDGLAQTIGHRPAWSL